MGIGSALAAAVEVSRNLGRKRVYRVQSDEYVLSEHKAPKDAGKSLKRYREYASKSLVGLTPETKIFISHWNGSQWVRVP